MLQRQVSSKSRQTLTDINSKYFYANYQDEVPATVGGTDEKGAHPPSYHVQIPGPPAVATTLMMMLIKSKMGTDRGRDKGTDGQKTASVSFESERFWFQTFLFNDVFKK